MTSASYPLPQTGEPMTDRERAIKAIRRGVPLGEVVSCSCHTNPPTRNGCFGVCEDSIAAIIASYEDIRAVQVEQTALHRARQDALEEAAKVADGWVAECGDTEIIYTSARKYARDAIEDVASAIRVLKLKGADAVFATPAQPPAAERDDTWVLETARELGEVLGLKYCRDGLWVSITAKRLAQAIHGWRFISPEPAVEQELADYTFSDDAAAEQVARAEKAEANADQAVKALEEIEQTTIDHVAVRIARAAISTIRGGKHE